MGGGFVACTSMSTAGRLSRNLSWIHSVAVIVGTMVGAGIFIVTGTAAELMGPAVPLGFSPDCRSCSRLRSSMRST